MKKLFILITIVCAIALVISGCHKSSANSAGTASLKTADQLEATVKRLESLSIQDFNFPATLGSDFFVDLNSAITTQTSNSRSIRNTTERAFGGSKYRSRHFNIENLNRMAHTRNAFLDKLDDLYILCADISAANEKCKKAIEDIKIASTELKSNAKAIKKSDIDNKQTFTQFKDANSELDSAVKKLQSDRNNIKNRIKELPKNSKSSIDVDSLTMRYMMIMNKVETRLKLLEDTKEKIANLNNEAKNVLNNINASDIIYVSAPAYNQETPACKSPDGTKCVKPNQDENQTAVNQPRKKSKFQTLPYVFTNEDINALIKRSIQPSDSPSVTGSPLPEKFPLPKHHHRRPRQKTQETEARPLLGKRVYQQPTEQSMFLANLAS